MQVAHILFRLDPNATPDQVAATTAKAEEVRAASRRARTSPRWRRSTRTTPAAQNGGELGWFKQGRDARRRSRRPRRRLKVGEVSEPVRTNVGVHLIKVEAREERVAREPRRARRPDQAAAVQRGARGPLPEVADRRAAQAPSRGDAASDAAYAPLRRASASRSAWATRPASGRRWCLKAISHARRRRAPVEPILVGDLAVWHDTARAPRDCASRFTERR